MIFYIIFTILFSSYICLDQNKFDSYLKNSSIKIECGEDFASLTVGSMRRKIEVTSAFVGKTLINNKYLVFLLINNYYYLTVKYDPLEKPETAKLSEPSLLKSVKDIWPQIYLISPNTLIKAIFFYKECLFIMKGIYLWCYNSLNLDKLKYGPVRREKVFAFFNHLVLKRYNIHSIQFIPRADNYYDLFIVYVGTIFEIPLFFRGNTTFLINYDIFKKFNQEFRVIHYFTSLATINTTLGIEFHAGYYKFFRVIHNVKKGSVSYYFRFYFPNHLNILYQCMPVVCLDNFDAIDYLNTTHFIIFIKNYFWFIPIIYQNQLSIHLSIKSARSIKKELGIDEIDTITNNSTYFDKDNIEEKSKKIKFFFIFSNKMRNYYVYGYRHDQETFYLLEVISFEALNISKNVLASFFLNDSLYIQLENEYFLCKILSDFKIEISSKHNGFIGSIEIINCDDIIISKNKLLLFFGFKYTVIQNNTANAVYTIVDINSKTAVINCQLFDYSMSFRSLRDFVSFVNYNEDIYLFIEKDPLEIFVKHEYEEKSKLKIAIVTLITIIIIFASIIALQTFGYLSKGANWDDISEDESNAKLEEERHRYILGELEPERTSH